MFTYQHLLSDIDYDISGILEDDYGIKCVNAYNKYCGKLQLSDLFTTDSVYVAAKRAAVGFAGKNDTQRFMQASWMNSYRLCQRVLDGSFKPSYYRSHVITERGKERTIVPPTFECKVVQKILCELLLRPVLTPKMVSTSYASIVGRGTDLMYKDVLSALNHIVFSDCNLSDYVIVMCDYRHYFDSINIQVLKERVLDRYIADDDIIALLMKFFPDECGLSLGSEVSQMPATFFPSPLDHEMKDHRGLPYFRYMDDSLAIVHRADVADYIDAYKRFSADLKLCVPDEKIEIVQFGKCFSFCKERFRFVKKGHARYVREVNPKRISTEKRKLEHFAELVDVGAMSKRDALAQWRAVRGSLVSQPRTIGDVRVLDDIAAEIMNM